MSRRQRIFPLGKVIIVALLCIAGRQWGFLIILSLITVGFFWPDISSILAWRRSKLGRQQTHERSPAGLPPQDGSFGWQYSPKQCFFTRSEAAFYYGVRNTVPADHHVFPKVRLSDLVDIGANGRERMSAFA